MPHHTAEAVREHGARVVCAVRDTDKLLAQDAAAGAQPVLYAAPADLPGDSFTGPEHMAHTRGGAELIKRSKTAADPDLAKRLWTASEELTMVHFVA